MEKVIILLTALLVVVLTIIYYGLILLKMYRKEIMHFLNDKKDTSEEKGNEPEQTEIIIKTALKNDICGHLRTYNASALKYPSSDRNTRTFISPGDNGETNINITLNPKENNTPNESEDKDIVQFCKEQLDNGGVSAEDLKELANAVNNKTEMTEQQEIKIRRTLDEIKDTSVFEQLLQETPGFLEFTSKILHQNRIKK